jgi:hypothetical protein
LTGDGAMSDDLAPALAYSRRAFENVSDWYKNADAKAQVLLTLDGALVSLLAGSVFVKADDLREVLCRFGAETWAFSAGMVLALLGSVYAALTSIHPRLKDPRELMDHLDDIVRDDEGRLKQKPETTWFFGHIAHLKDRKRFQNRMREVTEADEVAALSSQIFLLSRNVLQKHLWVNRGFLLIAVALTLLLAAAVSYVCRTVG